MRATLLICKETRRKLREPCQSKRLCTKDGGNRKKYKADLDQQGVQSGWLKEMVVNYNKITIEEEVEDLRNHLKALQERMAGLGVEDEKVGKIRTKKTRRWKRQSRRSNLRQVRHLQQQHRDLRRWTFKMVETVWCKVSRVYIEAFWKSATSKCWCYENVLRSMEKHRLQLLDGIRSWFHPSVGWLMECQGHSSRAAVARSAAISFLRVISANCEMKLKLDCTSFQLPCCLDLWCVCLLASFNKCGSIWNDSSTIVVLSEITCQLDKSP